MSNCYANPGPIFLPAMRLIYSITNAYPAVVTTTCNIDYPGGAWTSVPADHNYTTGIIIRFYIPYSCGMKELDGFVGEITVTGAQTFTINCDTTNFSAFTFPVAPDPEWVDTCPMVVPIAENTNMLTEAERNVLF